MTATPRKRVIFSADCDEDGNCPVYAIDFGDCDCDCDFPGLPQKTSTNTASAAACSKRASWPLNLAMTIGPTSARSSAGGTSRGFVRRSKTLFVKE